MKTFKLISCLFFLLLLANPLHARDPFVLDNSVSLLVERPIPLHLKHHAAMEVYELGNIKQAYYILLDIAFAGDFTAFTQAGVLVQAHPELKWDVPGDFFEKKIIEILGEGEGCFFLGFAHANTVNDHSQKLAQDYFLRSAYAGNLDGTFAAGYVAGDWQASMPPPPGSPVIDTIPPKFLATLATQDMSYWITKSANLGYGRAALWLAVSYLKPRAGTPNLHKAEKYGEIGTKGAFFSCAALLGNLYLNYEQKLNPEKYFYYATLYVLSKAGEIDDETIDNLIEMLRDSPANKKKISLPRPLIDEQIAKAEKDYDEIVARKKAEWAELDRLYNSAAKKLPDIGKEYYQLLEKK